ncbi:hypothetical protein D9613_011849 [Agrocybe pediades]|uniref:F-box domain-containing protein n=1 Tax=Agrocybe pediades TaxID=84607 RepID=A0A8H4QL07_9AGAR|nr:hypothetical protein D9613_011849 [Agrocybe pediades]
MQTLTALEQIRCGGASERHGIHLGCVMDASDFELSRREKRCAFNFLPPELLMEIFLKNTEPIDNWSDDRLTTARYTSQVCQKWRSLVLPSTCIWGRLLIMHDVEKATDEWREELRSRLGDAMLCITGFIRETSSRSFLASLLNEKWRNVQIFDVRISRPRAPDAIWPTLHSEAVNLETFRVEAYYQVYHSTPSTSRPIFDNVAPQLRHFHAKSIIPFSPVAPWLSNLRSISFNSTHDISFIFPILKLTPLLETLEVWGNILPARVVIHEENAEPTSIHLPGLTWLHISRRHFIEVFSLLEHITPSPCCGLVVTWMQGRETGTSADIERMYAAMVKWISAFVNSHRPTFVELKSEVSSDPGESSDAHFLGIRGVPEYPHRKPLFEVKICFDDPGGYFALRELATCPGFSFVQRLTLAYVPETGDELLPLYQAFSGVTKLIIIGYCDSMQAFQHDSRLQRQVPIFPLLHTMQVWVLEDFPASVGYMFDFLEYRAGVGLPVSLLKWFGNELTQDQKDCLRQCQVDGLVIEMP